MKGVVVVVLLSLSTAKGGGDNNAGLLNWCDQASNGNSGAIASSLDGNKLVAAQVRYRESCTLSHGAL